jgi:S-methylmethionine-dependent homocysteine/selenocysteine methylase
MGKKPHPMNNTRLPHQTDLLYATDGGLETTIVYHDQMELPCFAAFHLLRTDFGRAYLHRYYQTYAGIAIRYGIGFILESPTWRANPDWAVRLGYSPRELVDANQDAIGLMHEIRTELEQPGKPMTISGCVGPRGDGYQPSAIMGPAQAAAYHGPQIRTYRDAGADLITGITMNYLEEALGIANAAATFDIPAVLSFTVETDGNLPTGQSLGDVIRTIDAHAIRPPAYYMINCAHPTHFQPALPAGASWLQRIRGLRANASCRRHAELDSSSELDIGNPLELAERYRQLRTLLPNLQVLGGCCGTDHRHVEAICASCIELEAAC